MQRLLDRHRFNDVDRALRFLTIRLRSRPLSAPLAEQMVQARSKVRETEERYQDALMERVAATAEIHYLDAQLDETVMAVSREALVLTGGRRDDPRYVKLFASSPSAGMSSVGGDRQDQFVRNILWRLREDADFEPLRAHAETLAARQAELSAAVERRRQLSVPEAAADADRRIALEEARRLYNRAEAHLRLLFDNESLVESYFITLHKSRSGVEEELADEEDELGDEEVDA